jgi:D-tyrosyl-tRNA(Tyr) deacylase
MRILVQRVARAQVSVEGRVVVRTGRGLLVFAGFAPADGTEQVRWMCEKILRMRLFEDDQGKMNLSVGDVGGSVLVVSQFTLYGDVRKGNRPGFSEAAPPGRAAALYEEMIATLSGLSAVPVEQGIFGADMQVELINDGPVTIFLER